MHEQLASEGYAPVVGAIDTLLAAGRDSRDFRADVTGEDLLLLVGFLRRLELTTDRDRRSARLLDVVLDGLTGPDRLGG